MKINVGLVLDVNTQERVVCGSLDFDSTHERPQIMFIDEKAVKLPNGKELIFSSTYEKSTENISIFARENDHHVFTAIFSWNYIATCFAFRLTDGTFTEIFLEK